MQLAPGQTYRPPRAWKLSTPSRIARAAVKWHAPIAVNTHATETLDGSSSPDECNKQAGGHHVRHPGRFSYLLIISYDGTDFAGYQLQRPNSGSHRKRNNNGQSPQGAEAMQLPALRTVHSVLEQALCTRLQTSSERLTLKVGIRTVALMLAWSWRTSPAHLACAPPL